MIQQQLPFVFVIVGLTGLIGCRKAEEITTYEVPAPAKVADASPPTVSRALAAAFRQPDQVWFFKVTGPEAQVAAQATSFQKLIASVQFSDGKPTWTLPEGWTATTGAGMRFATISAPGELETTVIALPLDKYDELQNVNRWRGQLGLAPLTATDLEANITRKDVHGVPVVGVDISGALVPGGPMSGGTSSAPFARGPLPPENAPAARSAASEISTPPAAASTTATAAEVPAHWKPGRMSAMRKAAYDIVDGDQKAEITVIVLSAQSGSLEDNVNRWRGQLGLDPQDAAAIQGAVQKVSVAAHDGSYLEIFKNAEDPQAPAMLAAFVKTDDQTWYFKLTAPTALAQRERDPFRKFVEQYPIP